MRALLLTGLLFTLLSFSAPAQTIETDAVLKTLRSQLPDGWVMEMKDKHLVFYRKDSVWVKHTVNKMNQPAGMKKLSEEERIASFKKEGHRTRVSVTYRTDTKWSAQAIKKSEEQNKKTFAQIARLPEKFKIENLYDSILSEKGGEYYVPKTDADKEQIKKYQEEKNRLLKTIVQVPFLQTEKLCLFLDTCTGGEDATTDVYPEQASSELYKIRNTVMEVCTVQP
jgi:hypothetical protein